MALLHEGSAQREREPHNTFLDEYAYALYVAVDTFREQIPAVTRKVTTSRLIEDAAGDVLSDESVHAMVEAYVNDVPFVDDEVVIRHDTPRIISYRPLDRLILHIVAEVGPLTTLDNWTIPMMKRTHDATKQIMARPHLITRKNSADPVRVGAVEVAFYASINSINGGNKVVSMEGLPHMDDIQRLYSSAMTPSPHSGFSTLNGIFGKYSLSMLLRNQQWNTEVPMKECHVLVMVPDKRLAVSLDESFRHLGPAVLENFYFSMNPLVVCGMDERQHKPSINVRQSGRSILTYKHFSDL